MTVLLDSSVLSPASSTAKTISWSTRKRLPSPTSVLAPAAPSPPISPAIELDDGTSADRKGAHHSRLDSHVEDTWNDVSNGGDCDVDDSEDCPVALPLVPPALAARRELLLKKGKTAHPSVFASPSPISARGGASADRCSGNAPSFVPRARSVDSGIPTPAGCAVDGCSTTAASSPYRQNQCHRYHSPVLAAPKHHSSIHFLGSGKLKFSTGHATPPALELSPRSPTAAAPAAEMAPQKKSSGGGIRGLCVPTRWVARKCQKTFALYSSSSSSSSASSLTESASRGAGKSRSRKSEVAAPSKMVRADPAAAFVAAAAAAVANGGLRSILKKPRDEEEGGMGIGCEHDANRRHERRVQFSTTVAVRTFRIIPRHAPSVEVAS